MSFPQRESARQSKSLHERLNAIYAHRIASHDGPNRWLRLFQDVRSTGPQPPEFVPAYCDLQHSLSGILESDGDRRFEVGHVVDRTPRR